MRIAIVGTGIAGLTCAHLLHGRHEVTVFEADARPGGHTHTVTVDLGDEQHRVDTGFLVYNERTYPGLVRLFARLGVATEPSDMSFSLSDERTGLEWRGTSLQTIFAQRRNLLRPRFHRMLADIVRFNRVARGLAGAPADDGLTLGDLLGRGAWSDDFTEWYLLPMASAIWSADRQTVLRMPAATLARFFASHGLLSLGHQPRWRTVTGGAETYVRAILDPLGDRVRLATPVHKIRRRRGGVELLTDRHGPEEFEHVVVAAHGDQALRLLADPTGREREVLGAFRYQPNLAVLHTDSRLLPRNRRARASWNYHLTESGSGGATLTYHLNRLQSLSSRYDLCVTLNRPEAVRPDRVLGTFEVEHPMLDGRAVAAQRRHHEVNGHHGVSFCGAYWGYGFHEDGLQSALQVCRPFGAVL